MWIGMRYFLESISSALTWSLCSWVIKIALMRVMSPPTLCKAPVSARKLRPASIKISSAPQRKYVQLPFEPEYSDTSDTFSIEIPLP